MSFCSCSRRTSIDAWWIAPRQPRGLSRSRNCLRGSSCRSGSVEVALTLHLHRRRLIGDIEVVERGQHRLWIDARRQLECIDSAAGHEEDLIALHMAHGAYFPGELEPVAQYPRLAVSAALARRRELDGDQRQPWQVGAQQLDTVSRTNPY